MVNNAKWTSFRSLYIVQTFMRKSYDIKLCCMTTGINMPPYIGYVVIMLTLVNYCSLNDLGYVKSTWLSKWIRMVFWSFWMNFIFMIVSGYQKCYVSEAIFVLKFWTVSVCSLLKYRIYSIAVHFIHALCICVKYAYLIVI